MKAVDNDRYMVDPHDWLIVAPRFLLSILLLSVYFPSFYILSSSPRGTSTIYSLTERTIFHYLLLAQSTLLHSL